MANVVLDALVRVLEDNARDGKRTVIVIDEAHTITDPEVWTGLRLLLNHQWADRFLLTLLLLGQPELQTLLDANKPFAQRIAIRCHLQALSETESRRYVTHRLAVAGRSDALFTEEALAELVVRSGGLPRRINHLCDLALLEGFGRNVDRLNGAIVREVSQALEGSSKEA